MNHLKLIFLLSLIYMSFVGWSSNNWLMIWFIMEIIFLFFVGFVLVDVNYGIIELMIKYFITQVFISLMFSGLMVIYMFNLSCCVDLWLGVVLFMKLGMFPFYFWVIMVFGKLNWFSFLLITTIIKLLPILLIYYLNVLFNLMFMLLLSIFAGSILGLGNTSMQKLLGYSSLVHLCWLLLSLSISMKVFLIYFFCYFLMMMIFVFIFDLMNIFYINQFKLVSSSIYVKFLVFFLVISFAGFPPFLGFVLKWIVTSLVFYFNMKIAVFFMVSLSLFSVLFYLELFYYFMMMFSLSIGWYGYSFSGMVKLYSLVLLSYAFVYIFI